MTSLSSRPHTHKWLIFLRTLPPISSEVSIAFGSIGRVWKLILPANPRCVHWLKNLQSLLEEWEECKNWYAWKDKQIFNEATIFLVSWPCVAYGKGWEENVSDISAWVLKLWQPSRQVRPTLESGWGAIASLVPVAVLHYHCLAANSSRRSLKENCIIKIPGQM